MKILIAKPIYIYFLFISTLCYSQQITWNWAVSAEGYKGRTVFIDEFTDNKGNTFILAELEDSTLTIDGESVFNSNWGIKEENCSPGTTPCYVYYYSDLIIMKITSDGHTEWVQTIEGSGSQKGLSITGNDQGEVWIVASSDNYFISIDNLNTTFPTRPIQYNQDYPYNLFLAKLNNDGTPNYIHDLNLETGTLITSELFFDNDTLLLFATLGKREEDEFQVFGENITTSDPWGNVFGIKLNSSNGEFISHKELGLHTGLSDGNHTMYKVKYFKGNYYMLGTTKHNDIQFDDIKVSFKDVSFFFNYYITTLNKNLVASSVFEHINKTLNPYLNFDVNDDFILIPNKEFAFSNYENFLKLSYYDHHGNKTRDYYLKNNTKEIPNFGFSDFILNDDNSVELAFTFLDSAVTFNQKEYFIKPLFLKTPESDIKKVIHSDIFLLKIQNDEISDIIHINGQLLSDRVLKITRFDNRTRVIGYYQSDHIDFGEISLHNTRKIDTTLISGVPYHLARSNNLFISEFETGDIILSNPKSNIINKGIVYPNPTTGPIHINSNSDWELINIMGTTIDNGTSREVDLTKLESGIYFLKTNGETIRLFLSK